MKKYEWISMFSALLLSLLINSQNPANGAIAIQDATVRLKKRGVKKAKRRKKRKENTVARNTFFVSEMSI
jgi:hypothetical protein